MCQWRRSLKGSPPRVRGKVDEVDPLPAVTRITPACAGKSIQRSGPLYPPWDHPRVCGEKTALPPKQCRLTGSPPRVRGKGAAVAVIAKEHGITPARTGKSCQSFCFGSSGWDHPRACGEKYANLTPKQQAEGSPPRVRGKAGFPPGALCHVGITPARAGKRPHVQRRANPV